MPGLLSAKPSSATHASRAAELIPHIRDLQGTLRSCTSAELEIEVRNLRQELSNGSAINSPEVLVAGIALSSEALLRAHNIGLYDVQLMAVVNLASGRIAQMATGEGKTFVAIATAAHLALAGKGVHVMTPNSYLATRDCEQSTEVLRQLGMTVGLTPEQGDPADKRRAYDCDVTYGTGHEFGFDYLRDQLTLRNEANVGLGVRLLNDLRSTGPRDRTTMQRGLHFAVVDEADSVMIDDAGSPLVLSVGAEGLAPDLAAHMAAKDIATALEEDAHFHWNHSTGRMSLTNDGMERCYRDDVQIPENALLRPWTSYVEHALRARHIFRRNVHYVTTNDEIRIVDETTGRIFEDRSWQDGLHQAIEAKEDLPVTPEKASLAQITRQRFYRLYKNLCGMTGTAVGCEREFQHIYRSEVAEIPLRLPSARRQMSTRFFIDRTSKHDSIVEEIRDIHASGRPILVGTQSIADSEDIAKRLSRLELPYELLNGLQTVEEAEVIAQAGERSAITISTNLAGRGTDISVEPNVLLLGGLHVIVVECQLSSRMDRQLIGRCARQGNPGTSQTFVSADDTLIKRFGTWLQQAIHREAGDNAEAVVDFTTAVKRIQLAAEKQQFQGRAELLRQDEARDVLLGRA